MTMTSRAGLAVCLLALAQATSCAGYPSPFPDPRRTESPTPVPVARIVAAECPRDGTGIAPPYPDENHGGTKPAGFVGVGVLRCVRDDLGQKPDGSMVYRITELSGDLTPRLSAALELEDGPPPINPLTVCPAQAIPLLYLLITDESDRAYRSRIPEQWCGEPLIEVTQAVDAIEWTTVREFSVTRR